MIAPTKTGCATTVPGAKCILNESKCFFARHKETIVFVGGTALAAAIGYGIYWYFYQQDEHTGGNSTPPPPPPDGRPRRRSRSRSRTRSDASKKRAPSVKPSNTDLVTARPGPSTPVPQLSTATVGTSTSNAETSTKTGPSYANVAVKDLNDQKTQEDSHDKL